MALLLDTYMKLETLEQLVAGVKAKQKADPKIKGIAFTIDVRDEVDQYGNNVRAWVSQSKEDREAKKDRFWVGNGKSFWTDGNLSLAKDLTEGSTQSSAVASEDGLPF